MTTASVNWSEPVTINFSKGKPCFPTLEPRSAGLYRLTFGDGYKYIGKGKDLNCRLGNYRNPCAGVDVENILHLILLEANRNNQKVTVETSITDNRHVLERQEIAAAIRRGEKILNKGGLGYPRYVEFKVKYYETILDDAKVELQHLTNS